MASNSPASVARDEKLRIGRQLERLKVDVRGAGFAASSNGDFEAVQWVSTKLKHSTIFTVAGTDVSGTPDGNDPVVE